MAKTDIVFASSNAGKMRELQSLLDTFNLTVVPQTALQVSDVAETATTFVENALIKARHACQQTKLPAIADDSGLAVTALHGAPGIYSARFAGEHATAAMNIQKLLADLKDVPQQQRSACFHCVLVFMMDANDPTPLICHGVWHGYILSSPQGDAGFGYDPIFYVPSEQKSAAELSMAVKNRISHRGQALRLLVEKLPTFLSEN